MLHISVQIFVFSFHILTICAHIEFTLNKYVIYTRLICFYFFHYIFHLFKLSFPQQINTYWICIHAVNICTHNKCERLSFKHKYVLDKSSVCSCMWMFASYIEMYIHILNMLNICGASNLFIVFSHIGGAFMYWICVKLVKCTQRMFAWHTHLRFRHLNFCGRYSICVRT